MSKKPSHADPFPNLPRRFGTFRELVDDIQPKPKKAKAKKKAKPKKRRKP